MKYAIITLAVGALTAAVTTLAFTAGASAFEMSDTTSRGDMAINIGAAVATEGVCFDYAMVPASVEIYEMLQDDDKFYEGMNAVSFMIDKHGEDFFCKTIAAKNPHLTRNGAM